jgi:hypothetical protein
MIKDFSKIIRFTSHIKAVEAKKIKEAGQWLK